MDAWTISPAVFPGNMVGEMRHGRPLLAALAAALTTAPGAVAHADPPDLVPEAPSGVAVTGGKLTFLSTVRNAGGPLVLDATRPARAVRTLRADQLVEHAAGRFTVRRDVGRMSFRRARWRLRDFGRYELHRGADGAVVRSAAAPAACTGLQCGLPGVLALRFDVQSVPGSGSLDVTGLPAGDYRLVHRVNAGVALLESDYANDAACIGLRLGRSVTEIPC